MICPLNNVLITKTSSEFQGALDTFAYGIFINKVAMLFQVMFAGMTEVQLEIGNSWRAPLNIVVIG